MNSSRTMAFGPLATEVPGAGGRWRSLAELTATGFAPVEDDSVPSRVAGALAALFEGPALVLGGTGDDAALVVRGPAGAPGLDGLPERAVALARAAARDHRALCDESDGASVLAAPLRGREGPIGALVVTSARPGGAEDAAVLECFSAHAARALDSTRRHAGHDLLESERRQAIGELAAGVAHHLNNLMTVVLGNVQLLLRQPLQDASARSLTAIERAVLDAADVVRRLAASTGRPFLGTHTSLDLNALVDDALALSRARWHDEAHVRGVTIHARFERGELPDVVADEGEVREVLLNLLLNAVDALAGGGDLVVRTWTHAGRVVCAVTDTGDGMTPEVRRRATEPFFTTRGPGRRGLGLSVAAGIVERHRGALTIDSRVGHGTTVTFSLPACVTSRRDIPEAAVPAVRGLRILVVDDEEAVRTTIAELLTATGHETILAGSGDEALTCLATAGGEVDVVFTDLGMPGLTGWDVIERVKAEWPGLPVVLVTGWGEHPRGADGRQAPDAIIAKPITEGRLREVIAGAVAAA